MKAAAVCQRLCALADAGTRSGAVHSVFDHAANLALDGREGLVGLIAADRSLTPYAVSVRLDEPFSQAGICAGMTALLTDGAVDIPEAGARICFSAAKRVDLSVDAVPIAERAPRPRTRLPVLRSVLQSGDASAGLSPLVTGAETNVYADFLRPRVRALVEAVAKVDGRDAALAAERLAGCGPGLTPSSDDLLTGYLATVRVLARAGFGPDARAFLPALAARAAAKTNRVSATFLLQSGEGLVNEWFLTLLRTIFSNADDGAVERAAKRAASIGSTSGGDMLTGMALAIYHHDGGINSDSTGNQEKCLL